MELTEDGAEDAKSEEDRGGDDSISTHADVKCAYWNWL